MLVHAQVNLPSTLSYISCIELLPVSLDDSIQDLVGVGEHAVGEKKGGSIVRTGRVRDEEGEQGGDGVDLVTWPAGMKIQIN